MSVDWIIDLLETAPPDSVPVEVVERKGLGHPDTICDALADAFSRRLSREYLEHFGRILHHNVDKLLLVGGRARPAFGGGEVLEPIELYFAGRAVREFEGRTVPVEALALETTHAWLGQHLHALEPERHVRVHCRVRPGSVELVDLFARGGERVALANDTSCGVGFAPLSSLERLVLEVERRLTAPETRRAHPELGEDVKLMAFRRERHVELVVACAMVGRFLADFAAYARARETVARLARETARAAAPELELAVDVNAADDLARGRVYLTVTGTSAEAGDDGEVGRGNRVNGLITPGRPMTMEAPAGKNPVSHVGKLYNVAAGRLAGRLVNTIEEISEAHCCLVSEIGRPVTEPRLARLQLRLAPGAGRAPLEARVRAVANELLGEIPHLWRGLVAGEETPE